MGVQVPSIISIYYTCTIKQNPISKLEREQRGKNYRPRRDLNLFLAAWILWEWDERGYFARRLGIWFKLQQWGFSLGLLTQEVEFPCRNNLYRTHIICDSDRKMQHYPYGQVWGFWKCSPCQPISVMFADLPYKVKAPKAGIAHFTLYMFHGRPTTSTEDIMYLLTVAYWLGIEISAAKTFI